MNLLGSGMGGVEGRGRPPGVITGDRAAGTSGINHL